jgi:hypothetical protein
LSGRFWTLLLYSTVVFQTTRLMLIWMRLPSVIE